MWAVKIKEAEVGGACGKHRGEEVWVRTLGRITTVKKPLARPKFKLEGDIQMDPEETRWLCMDLIHLAYERGNWWAFVNTVTKFRVQ